jgi:hypothetical protein
MKKNNTVVKEVIEGSDPQYPIETIKTICKDERDALE